MTGAVAAVAVAGVVALRPGDHFIQPAPVDTKYIHQHPATAAIPLVSGTKEVPGGTVQIQSTDIEARDSIQDTAALTDPSALSFHSAQYVFNPSGPVLSPEQFATLVSAPIFPAAMQQLGDLRTQMEQNQMQSQSQSK